MIPSPEQKAWNETFVNEKTIFIDSRRGVGLPKCSWWADCPPTEFYVRARQEFEERMFLSYFSKTSASLIAPLRGLG